jgi:pyrimidine deaminase RibD-like protein
VRTRVPQNSRGFIHQQDVNESREITKLHKLDSVLEKCIEMIRRGHESDPEKYGRVAACVIDNKNNHTYAINMPGPDGTRRHAERMAIDKHLQRHGRIGPNAIMITTLSPCVNHMDERYGESCTDLLSDYGIEKCYAGWQDPTQHPAEDYPFNLQVTDNADIFNTCKDIAASFLPQAMAEGTEQITWIKPNFDYEWDEIEFQAKQPQVPEDVRSYMAKHFPNKDAWLKAVQNGRAVVVPPDHGQKIRNYTDNKKDLLNALSPASHDPQGPAKAKRVNALFDKGGPIEMPIILKTSKGLWLIGGKTRLGTANLLKGISAKVWVIGGKKNVDEAYTGPPMKFLRPGELSGSYSPQQMQAMGFKQSANGSWYIPMNTWQRLVSGGQIREGSENVVNFPIANVRKPNGAIGTQGVTTNQVADVLTHLARLQVSPDMSMRELVDKLKADPQAQERLRQSLKQNPVQVLPLPDGSYDLKDGHHRTFLLNLLGDKTVPAIIRGGVPALPAHLPDHLPGEHDVRLPYQQEIPKPAIRQIVPPMLKEQDVEENFADGRHPEDKGDSKRHHVPTKSSVSNLRRFAKSHSGRAAQLAHWMANMKSGRAKKKKTNEAVDAQTVANFNTRVQFALAKIAQNTDPRYPDQKEFVQLIAANKVNIMNGNPSNPAFSSGHDLNMDAEEFHDAPIEVLILVMAHEIGHIIYGHTFQDPKNPNPTVSQEQQEEYDADQFAINIMKRIGITKIPVWTWLRRKKNDLEQFKRDQDAAPPGSWPTYNQRSDQARKMGVELTKANTDQIDQALQHMG